MSRFSASQSRGKIRNRPAWCWVGNEPYRDGVRSCRGSVCVSPSGSSFPFSPSLGVPGCCSRQQRQPPRTAEHPCGNEIEAIKVDGGRSVRANRICHPLHLNRTHLLPSSPLATLDALRICQKRIVIFCLCFIILLRTVDCRRHTVTPPHGHNLRAGVSTDGSVAPMPAPPRGRGSPPPPTPRPSPHHSILPRRCHRRWPRCSPRCPAPGRTAPGSWRRSAPAPSPASLRCRQAAVAVAARQRLGCSPPEGYSLQDSPPKKRAARGRVIPKKACGCSGVL